MKDLKEMAKTWDIEYNEDNIEATGTSRTVYSELCDTIEILSEFKFEPYQPVLCPPNPNFITRFKVWLEQFEESDKKYMLYLCSKIIFLTHDQIIHLDDHIFQRKITKIILEDIISEQKLPPFSYKEAKKYLENELQKTLFVGLSNSSRINDFAHINSEKVNRKTSMGIELETLLYSSKRASLRRPKLEEQEKELNKSWEIQILSKDPLLDKKERLVILEDISGSGEDITKNLGYLKSSSLPFKKVIFAPYIMTYKACEQIEKWIKSNKDDREYKYTYGTLIPEDSKCFGTDKSYLLNEWHDSSVNICEKIQSLNELIYTKFSDKGHPCGYGYVGIVLVTYYNCPDNSLPIIWYNKDNWNPLFKRAINPY